MVVKKNLILVILDSRRIFMLGLPFDDSNYFKKIFEKKFKNFKFFTCKNLLPGFSKRRFYRQTHVTV